MSNLINHTNPLGLRPLELLPVPFPCDYDPGPEYFYSNFVKPMIPDTIDMMCTGMHIDDNAVESLRSTIDDVLSTVDSKLLRNTITQKLQKQRYKVVQKVHYAKSTEAIRTAEFFYREYNNTVEHRTWVVNTYLKSKNLDKDIKPEWTVKALKNYNIFKTDKVLDRIIDKSIGSNTDIVVNGMTALAEYKTELWNRPRYDKANSAASMEPFNPGSAKQLQELFSMLKIPPMAFSNTTGDGSWGREYIEILYKQSDGTNKELDEVLECIIDHSFGGIIRTTFLKAFDTYTVDGVLHGNIKLFGAKSFRNTSNSPNLLNMPSSKSIYAKPLKKCFVAPEGMLIYAIDLSALEDRVIANLSGDVNKSNIFLEGLDGHSLNACGYFPDEVAEILGKNVDNVKYVKEFYERSEAGDKLLKAIRFKSKAPTFKLAYGGYPDASKGGVITQEIFDNYHNILYPSISDYRENYVLQTAREQGYIHLGLGCRIYTDNPDDDIRTLHNATAQFWSILTLIAINEINYRIKRDGMQGRVQVCSTIYDSIYFYVEEDAEAIKWLNDNAVEALCADYLEDQVVKNEAEGELGKNWSDLFKVINNASVEDINSVLETIYE
jgi:hypothetical protein